MDFHQIKSNMEKVIVGKSETIDLVLAALLAGGHIPVSYTHLTLPTNSRV